LNDNVFPVLVVDDDPGLLGIYQEILTSAAERFPPAGGSAAAPPRFRVTPCRQATEALEAIRGSIRAGESFSAVFMDVSLPPGPSGLWAAEEIIKLDPTANIVLVTGLLEPELGKIPRCLTFSDRLLFLQKPFHPQEIIQFACALSVKWRAERQVNALNANLEGLVLQRTLELQQSNERLQCEVERRQRYQQELQRSLADLKKMITGTVFAIAATVEKRDPYTSGHQQRVAELSRAIGRELGFSEDRVEGLYIAAVIHDIGKISLPAEILSKPTRLSPIELSLIQGHAQAGFDILKTIEFPWPVARIVLEHHERLDGSGYPKGLAGRKILREARIVGVADVVETMASHRPYRPSRGIDKALDEVRTHRGALYDPEVVDACLHLMQEKRFAFPAPVFP
jgi:HD-GYP domain-containing protein (c-di-GMP phosphodiesterase class II)